MTPRRLILIALFSALICGCSNVRRPVPRTETDCVMFAPVAMRIHPIFSGPKNWTGDDNDDGIEALIEFTDQFGDPTKASGTVIFELFAYRPYNPDPRGERLVNPWIGSLVTLADQQARWNRTSRTYTFQLEYPQIAKAKNCVLTATFDTGNTRFFDRIIIESKTKEPESAPTPAPAPPTSPPAAIGRADQP